MLASRFAKVLTVVITLTLVAAYGSASGQTPGYWKTHADATSLQYDSTWDVVGGSGAKFLSTGRTWLEELNTAPQGSEFHILAHQYIAAYLNISRDNFEELRIAAAPGTPSQEVRTMVQTAGDMLQGYKLNSITQLDGPTVYKNAGREDYISLSEALDAFNNMIAEQRELLEESDGIPLVPARVPTSWGQLKSGFDKEPR